MTDSVPSDPGVSPDSISLSAETLIVTPRHIWRRVSVWIVALLCGVLVPILVPAEARIEWLTFAVGFCVLVTFALQLGTAQREGFITRIATSIAGSVVIIAVAYVITLLVG